MKTNEEIEELALKVYRDYPNNPLNKPEWHYNQDINAPRKRKAFINGYKTAQQELFSLEDMSKCWNESAESINKKLSGIFEDSNSPWKPKTFDEFIKILKNGKLEKIK